MTVVRNEAHACARALPPSSRPYHSLSDPMPQYRAFELLTVSQVCAILKIKRSTFYTRIKAGCFPLLREGGLGRVRSDHLENYMLGLSAHGVASSEGN